MRGRIRLGGYHRDVARCNQRVVDACLVASHISLDQVVVDEKGNEITASPSLLKLLKTQAVW